MMPAQVALRRILVGRYLEVIGSRWSLLRVGIAISILLLPSVVMTPPADAFFIRVHKSITRDAFAGMGYNDDVVERVVKWNKETDWDANVDWRFPFNLFKGQNVEQRFGTNAKDFHFTDLPDLAAIEDYWAWLDSFNANVWPNPDVCNTPASVDFLHAKLGVLLHTVQDFYAHSNWVEMLLGHGVQLDANEALPIWFASTAAQRAAWNQPYPLNPNDPTRQHFMTAWWGDSTQASIYGKPTGSGLEPRPGHMTHSTMNKDWDGFLLGSKQGKRHDYGLTWHAIARNTAVQATIDWISKTETHLVNHFNQIGQDGAACLTNFKAGMIVVDPTDPETAETEVDNNAPDEALESSHHQHDLEQHQETVSTLCETTQRGLPEYVVNVETAMSWSLTGLWQATTFAGVGGDSDLDHTTPWRLHYGKIDGTFDTGAANAGEAALVPAQLAPGKPYALHFTTKWQIEAVNPSSFDIMTVEVWGSGGILTACVLNPGSDPGGSPAQSVCSNASPEGAFPCASPEWESRGLNFAAPEDGFAQVAFRFDTGDELYNNFMGWMVDDVEFANLELEEEPTL